MNDNPETESKKSQNLRSHARTKSQKNASVEFKPSNNTMVYHFKLKDFSSEGFGILVRKDSKVLKHIKAGDILTMMYHPDKVALNPIPHRTQIKHISEPEPGKSNDHLLVGLLILE